MNLRRIVAILLAAALAAAALPAGAGAAARTPVAVYVDGVELDAEPGAYTENGRTMVPMRAIFEALHARVTWDNREKTVTGRTADRTIVLRVDDRTAQVNGKRVTLDAPARLVDGRVMVPLRFVSESLGYPVYFNDKSGYYRDRLKVSIFTNPAVSLRYGEPIEDADTDDFFFTYYLNPAVRYIFKDGDRLHILHALQPGAARSKFLFSSPLRGVVIHHYDRNWNLLGKTEIEAELPLFGGFHRSEDGYFYIVYGQFNFEEDPSKPVYRVVKYDRHWRKAGQADIRDVFTSIPFDGSNVSMASRGDLLVVHSARTRYVSNDGLRHQSNITFKIRTTDMAVLDKGGEWPANHVSHSFGTFVRFDGSRIVYADHGDAYPRSFVIQVEEDGRVTDVRNVLEFPGEIGENYTGAQLGGLEVTDTHVLLAGASVYPKSSNLYAGSMNVFVAAVPKSDVGGAPIAFNWLTDLAGDPDGDGLPTEAEEVHLVPLGDGRHAVLWRQTGGGKSDGTYCAIVDGAGRTVKPPVKLGVPSPGNIDPLVSGDKLHWYETDGGKTAFYTVDLAKL